MRRSLLVAAVFGVLLATGVAAWVGLPSLLSAVERIGWRGLALFCGLSFGPLLLLGAAWAVLAPGMTPRSLIAFTWARAARDAGGELLPFSPLGGWVIGARAAILAGVDSALAYSTTLVDVTAELIAQAAFTAVGLGLLAVRLGSGSLHGGLALAVSVGLALLLAGAAAFIAVQRRGAALLEVLARRWAPGRAEQAGVVATAVEALYARPGRIALAVSIHLLAWVASAAAVWLVLRLVGLPIPLLGVVAMESLVTAARSAVAVAPMGLGIQEGAYALIGPLFGVGPELALAISLLKRARDLVVGLPCLLAWQAGEGRRFLAGGEPALPSGGDGG